VSQSRPKANRRRYEQQQLGNPALYELTTRADRILDVPSAVRRAQDSQGRSREPYGSHVESPVVTSDRVAKTPGAPRHFTSQKKNRAHLLLETFLARGEMRPLFRQAFVSEPGENVHRE